MKKLTLVLLCFMISIGWAFAQEKEVSGVVISAEDNQPLIGAAVFAKGSPNYGQQTNIDGKFRFTVPGSTKTLVITYVGMKRKEVPVGQNLRIVLEPDAQQLDVVEIVYSGYGTGRKGSTLASSVAKVSTKDIEEKPVANAFDAIQGKVSGLQVYTSSGEPSETSSIRLHGAGSLGASSSPLYIVDGVPVDAGTIMALNQNDFASFEVLKDAAATSIYGSRAANGVVYITTKKGKVADRALVTIRGMYGISNLANTDYFSSMMNADELTEFWIDYGLRSPEFMDKFRSKWTGDTQWYKYYYMKNRPVYSTDFSVSGGAGKTNYYISGSYFDQEGLRYGSDYDRMNLRANLNSAINDKITFGLNNSISYDSWRTNPYNFNSTNGGLALLALPFYSPYDEDGNEYPDKIPGWNRYTPRYLSEKNAGRSNSFALNSMGFVQIQPIEGLTLRSQVGLSLSDFRGTSTRYPSYIPNLGNGYRSESFSRELNFTNTNTLEYKFRVSDDHNFTVLLGHEYIDHTYGYFGGSGEGLSDDRLVLLGNTTKEKEVSSDVSEYAFLSYFSRLSYDLYNKYYIDLTLRNDASSRFGKSNRNAFFWSVGTMWRVKEEAFLKDLDWLSDLKLKYSVGTTGNAAIGNYNSYALVGSNNQYNTATGFSISSPGNPNLSWEKQIKHTVGLDFSLFRKLNVLVEYYNRITSSMLMNVPVPYYIGFRNGSGSSQITNNVGRYQNQGVDLKLNYDIWRDRKENYVSAYVNFNYNQDKVLELFQGLDYWIIPNTGVCFAVGEPVRFFYPLFKQVNPDTGAPEWYVPGDNIAHMTKEEVTTEYNDFLEQNTGVNRYAPINGGFGLNAQFAGIYLQADFSFSLGKHLIVNDAFFFENPSVFNQFNQRRSVKDFWKQPGDKTKFPSRDYQFTQFDSRMIQDASFMRLKNITLGYTLPKHILAKQNLFKGAKIYVTGRNLLTFTKFEGPDPEIDSNLTLGANPNTKQVSVGFEVSF